MSSAILIERDLFTETVPYLVSALFLVGVLLVTTLFINRIASIVITAALRWLLLSKDSTVFSLSGVQFAPLRMRLLFRELVYVGENMTVRALDGHITFNFWGPRLFFSHNWTSLTQELLDNDQLVGKTCQAKVDGVWAAATITGILREGEGDVPGADSSSPNRPRRGHSKAPTARRTDIPKKTESFFAAFRSSRNQHPTTMATGSVVVRLGSTERTLPASHILIPYAEGLVRVHVNGLAVSWYNNTGKYEQLERVMKRLAGSRAAADEKDPGAYASAFARMQKAFPLRGAKRQKEKSPEELAKARRNQFLKEKRDTWGERLMKFIGAVDLEISNGAFSAGGIGSSHPYFLHFGFRRGDGRYFITLDGVLELDRGRHVVDMLFERAECHWHHRDFDSNKAASSQSHQPEPGLSRTVGLRGAARLVLRGEAPTVEEAAAVTGREPDVVQTFGVILDPKWNAQVQLRYYWDDPGHIPADLKDIADLYSVMIGSGTSEEQLRAMQELPKYGLELFIDTEEMQYGSWCEYSRQQLMRFLNPATYQPLQNHVRASRGRAYRQGGATTSRGREAAAPAAEDAPMQAFGGRDVDSDDGDCLFASDSDDEVLSGGEEAVGVRPPVKTSRLRPYGTFELLVAFTRRTRLVMPFKHPADGLAPPKGIRDSGRVGALVLEADAGSYALMRMPLGFTAAEDHSCVGETYISLGDAQLKSSMIGDPFFSAANIELHIDTLFPEVWNQRQVWDTIVKARGAELHWLQDYVGFFQHFIADWGNVGALYHGLPLDVKHTDEFYTSMFVPMLQRYEIFFDDESQYSSGAKAAGSSFWDSPAGATEGVRRRGGRSSSVHSSSPGLASESDRFSFDGGSVPWSDAGLAIYINVNEQNVIYSADSRNVEENSFLVLAARRATIRCDMPGDQYRLRTVNDLLYQFAVDGSELALYMSLPKEHTAADTWPRHLPLARAPLLKVNASYTFALPRLPRRPNSAAASVPSPDDREQPHPLENSTGPRRRQHKRDVSSASSGGGDGDHEGAEMFLKDFLKVDVVVEDVRMFATVPAIISIFRIFDNLFLDNSGVIEPADLYLLLDHLSGMRAERNLSSWLRTYLNRAMGSRKMETLISCCLTSPLAGLAPRYNEAIYEHLFSTGSVSAEGVAVPFIAAECPQVSITAHLQPEISAVHVTVGPIRVHLPSASAKPPSCSNSGVEFNTHQNASFCFPGDERTRESGVFPELFGDTEQRDPRLSAGPSRRIVSIEDYIHIGAIDFHRQVVLGPLPDRAAFGGHLLLSVDGVAAFLGSLDQVSNLVNLAQELVAGLGCHDVALRSAVQRARDAAVSDPAASSYFLALRTQCFDAEKEKTPVTSESINRMLWRIGRRPRMWSADTAAITGKSQRLFESAWSKAALPVFPMGHSLSYEARKRFGAYMGDRITEVENCAKLGVVTWRVNVGAVSAALRPDFRGHPLTNAYIHLALGVGIQCASSSLNDTRTTSRDSLLIPHAELCILSEGEGSRRSASRRRSMGMAVHDAKTCVESSNLSFGIAVRVSETSAAAANGVITHYIAQKQFCEGRDPRGLVLFDDAERSTLHQLQAESVAEARGGAVTFGNEARSMPRSSVSFNTTPLRQEEVSPSAKDTVEVKSPASGRTRRPSIAFMEPEQLAFDDSVKEVPSPVCDFMSALKARDESDDDSTCIVASSDSENGHALRREQTFPPEHAEREVSEPMRSHSRENGSPVDRYANASSSDHVDTMRSLSSFDHDDHAASSKAPGSAVFRTCLSCSDDHEYSSDRALSISNGDILDNNQRIELFRPEPLRFIGAVAVRSRSSDVQRDSPSHVSTHSASSVEGEATAYTALLTKDVTDHRLEHSIRPRPLSPQPKVEGPPPLFAEEAYATALGPSALVRGVTGSGVDTLGDYASQQSVLTSAGAIRDHHAAFAPLRMVYVERGATRTTAESFLRGILRGESAPCLPASQQGLNWATGGLQRQTHSATSTQDIHIHVTRPVDMFTTPAGVDVLKAVIDFATDLAEPTRRSISDDIIIPGQSLDQRRRRAAPVAFHAKTISATVPALCIRVPQVFRQSLFCSAAALAGCRFVAQFTTPVVGNDTADMSLLLRSGKMKCILELEALSFVTSAIVGPSGISTAQTPLMPPRGIGIPCKVPLAANSFPAAAVVGAVDVSRTRVQGHREVDDATAVTASVHFDTIESHISNLFFDVLRESIDAFTHSIGVTHPSTPGGSSRWASFMGKGPSDTSRALGRRADKMQGVGVGGSVKVSCWGSRSDTAKMELATVVGFEQLSVHAVGAYRAPTASLSVISEMSKFKMQAWPLLCTLLASSRGSPDGESPPEGERTNDLNAETHASEADSRFPKLSIMSFFALREVETLLMHSAGNNVRLTTNELVSFASNSPASERWSRDFGSFRRASTRLGGIDSLSRLETAVQISSEFIASVAADPSAAAKGTVALFFRRLGLEYYADLSICKALDSPSAQPSPDLGVSMWNLFGSNSRMTTQTGDALATFTKTEGSRIVWFYLHECRAVLTSAITSAGATQYCAILSTESVGANAPFRPYLLDVVSPQLAKLVDDWSSGLGVALRSRGATPKSSPQYGDQTFFITTVAVKDAHLVCGLPDSVEGSLRFPRLFFHCQSSLSEQHHSARLHIQPATIQATDRVRCQQLKLPDVTLLVSVRPREGLHVSFAASAMEVRLAPDFIAHLGLFYTTVANELVTMFHMSTASSAAESPLSAPSPQDKRPRVPLTVAGVFKGCSVVLLSSTAAAVVNVEDVGGRFTTNDNGNLEGAVTVGHFGVSVEDREDIDRRDAMAKAKGSSAPERRSKRSPAFPWGSLRTAFTLTSQVGISESHPPGGESMRMRKGHTRQFSENLVDLSKSFRSPHARTASHASNDSFVSQSSGTSLSPPAAGEQSLMRYNSITIPSIDVTVRSGLEHHLSMIQREVVFHLDENRVSVDRLDNLRKDIVRSHAYRRLKQRMHISPKQPLTDDIGFDSAPPPPADGSSPTGGGHVSVRGTLVDVDVRVIAIVVPFGDGAYKNILTNADSLYTDESCTVTSQASRQQSTRNTNHSSQRRRETDANPRTTQPPHEHTIACLCHSQFVPVSALKLVVVDIMASFMKEPLYFPSNIAPKLPPPAAKSQRKSVVVQAPGEVVVALGRPRSPTLLYNPDAAPSDEAVSNVAANERDSIRFSSKYSFSCDVDRLNIYFTRGTKFGKIASRTLSVLLNTPVLIGGEGLLHVGPGGCDASLIRVPIGNAESPHELFVQNLMREFEESKQRVSIDRCNVRVSGNSDGQSQVNALLVAVTTTGPSVMITSQIVTLLEALLQEQTLQELPDTVLLKHARRQRPKSRRSLGTTPKDSDLAGSASSSTTVPPFSLSVEVSVFLDRGFIEISSLRGEDREEPSRNQSQRSSLLSSGPRTRARSFRQSSRSASSSSTQSTSNLPSRESILLMSLPLPAVQLRAHHTSPHALQSTQVVSVDVEWEPIEVVLPAARIAAEVAWWRQEYSSLRARSCQLSNVVALLADAVSKMAERASPHQISIKDVLLPIPRCFAARVAETRQRHEKKLKKYENGNVDARDINSSSPFVVFSKQINGEHSLRVHVVHSNFSLSFSAMPVSPTLLTVSAHGDKTMSFVYESSQSRDALGRSVLIDMQDIRVECQKRMELQAFAASIARVSVSLADRQNNIDVVCRVSPAVFEPQTVPHHRHAHAQLDSHSSIGRVEHPAGMASALSLRAAMAGQLFLILQLWAAAASEAAELIEDITQGGRSAEEVGGGLPLSISPQPSPRGPTAPVHQGPHPHRNIHALVLWGPSQLLLDLGVGNKHDVTTGTVSLELISMRPSASVSVVDVTCHVTKGHVTSDGALTGILELSEGAALRMLRINNTASGSHRSSTSSFSPMATNDALQLSTELILVSPQGRTQNVSLSVPRLRMEYRERQVKDLLQLSADGLSFVARDAAFSRNCEVSLDVSVLNGGITPDATGAIKTLLSASMASLRGQMSASIAKMTTAVGDCGTIRAGLLKRNVLPKGLVVLLFPVDAAPQDTDHQSSHTHTPVDPPSFSLSTQEWFPLGCQMSVRISRLSFIIGNVLSNASTLGHRTMHGFTLRIPGVSMQFAKVGSGPNVAKHVLNVELESWEVCRGDDRRSTVLGCRSRNGLNIFYNKEPNGTRMGYVFQFSQDAPWTGAPDPADINTIQALVESFSKPPVERDQARSATPTHRHTFYAMKPSRFAPVVSDLGVSVERILNVVGLSGETVPIMVIESVCEPLSDLSGKIAGAMGSNLSSFM